MAVTLQSYAPDPQPRPGAEEGRVTGWTLLDWLAACFPPPVLRPICCWFPHMCLSSQGAWRTESWPTLLGSSFCIRGSRHTGDVQRASEGLCFDKSHLPPGKAAWRCLTSSSLSKASFSFRCRSSARSHTCCQRAESWLIRGFFASDCERIGMGGGVG